MRSPLLLASAQKPAADDGKDHAEQDLFRRARRGDAAAFWSIVEAYQDRVFRIVTAVLHCDRAAAEDLCQEVFLRVHRALPGFDGAHPAAWLHRIATNVAISDYRAARAQKRAGATVSLEAGIERAGDARAPVSKEADPFEDAVRSELVQKVRACMQELPDEFRLAVVLRDVDGQSYEEIAEALSLPPGTVRSKIHRGRQLLQRLLLEEIR
jgi:RNA polymerase sigma-70 factor (ECF subfamily)